MLLLGHHGPVRGAATVRAECERIRDAVQYVHDATVAAMNDGRDVWTAMREIALPEQLDLGEAYGRVDWSVRAIWETYAGWFHQHSTLDLYGAPPEHGRERDRRARGRRRRGRGARRRRSPTPTRSPRCACASSRSRSTPSTAARSTRTARAHEQLLAEHGRANFWLTRWLEGEIRSATNRLDRLDRTT